MCVDTRINVEDKGIHGRIIRHVCRDQGEAARAVIAMRVGLVSVSFQLSVQRIYYLTRVRENDCASVRAEEGGH